MKNLTRVYEVPPDLLPELPELADMEDEAKKAVIQPGTTTSFPTRVPVRRLYKRWSAAAAAIAAVLIAGVLLASFALRGQPAQTGNITQKGPVFYVTPPGGPAPASTVATGPGGPMILSSPTPPFFVDGNLYRDSTVYDTNTGAPIQQYLKSLGDVMIYQPRLVDGILYMAVRAPFSQASREMTMHALRANDGAVLWKWADCGESDNMSPAAIVNQRVYFVCESAPAVYRLYALQAKTGKLLWVDTLSGEASFDLYADQQTVYVGLDNRILAESANAGKLLWQKSLEENGDYINQIELDKGILYIAQQKTFYAMQVSSGALLWEYRFLGDFSFIQFVVAQNVVYLFADQQSGPTYIYTLNGTSGALRWQKQLDSGTYGFPAVDNGNLYLVEDVFANPQQNYPSQFKRTLLAIQGSSGHTLWQQDIPWNRGKLDYAMIEPPAVTAGAGRIYLVDWQSASEPQNLKATMGAFSESNGALVWTRNITQIW